jgi:hypothetical protein
MSASRPRAIRKRLTLTLTHAQYRQLAGAVDRASQELAEDGRGGEAATLERAWDRLRDAWHEGPRQ